MIVPGLGVGYLDVGVVQDWADDVGDCDIRRDIGLSAGVGGSGRGDVAWG